MYHGGTIFRDAASKYIHVENQVSLGAGDTTVAKLKFEEWLWEQARVSVRHYHSDNGVFQAEIFTDACKEAHQTQSFSGVGAQHQNAEAERAIQTVMYMARSFMIHTALNWGEHGSDDIKL
jgi:transposase InsO family protein